MSPLSASMALGMTMNGASGSTFDEMRSTLGLGLQSSAEINASYRSLIDMLRALDRTVDVRIANAIWYRAGFPFETQLPRRVEAVLRREGCSARLLRARGRPDDQRLGEGKHQRQDRQYRR